MLCGKTQCWIPPKRHKKGCQLLYSFLPLCSNMVSSGSSRSMRKGCSVLSPHHRSALLLNKVKKQQNWLLWGHKTPPEWSAKKYHQVLLASQWTCQQESLTLNSPSTKGPSIHNWTNKSNSSIWTDSFGNIWWPWHCTRRSMLWQAVCHCRRMAFLIPSSGITIACPVVQSNTTLHPLKTAVCAMPFSVGSGKQENKILAADNSKP